MISHDMDTIFKIIVEVLGYILPAIMFFILISSFSLFTILYPVGSRLSFEVAVGIASSWDVVVAPEVSILLPLPPSIT
jgi:hypothetical protein